MSGQPRIAGTLSKITLEAKAQTGKAAKAKCTGRKQKRTTSDTLRRKDCAMLQKQLLHKYISVNPPKKKKCREGKRVIKTMIGK